MFDFNDIIGQNTVKAHLRTAAVSDRVSHAYMLIGEAGMGKRALADAFSKMLLCENDPGCPCGRCHSCIQVEAGTHPDVIHVTHEKPNSIGVDDVRGQLSAEAAIRPFSGKKKIFIVPHAEIMTAQAQNALLKTLEEPPEYAVILLLTESEDALLETIRSRCVKLKLRPVPDEELIPALMKKNGVPREQAALAAGFARGIAGKAEQMAVSQEFRAGIEADLSLLEHLPQGGMDEVLKDIAEIRERYPDPSGFLDFVRMYYRDLLAVKMSRDRKGLIFAGEEERIGRAAGGVSLRAAGRILDGTDRAEDRLRANVNPDLALELLLQEIRQSSMKG